MVSPFFVAVAVDVVGWNRRNGIWLFAAGIVVAMLQLRS
jgi:hypothetical protein